jgi:tRNA (adenine22-N1)-methyltransferase
MPLSDRLEGILAMLAPCRLLVDVGTQHGLVPLAALARGIAESAIGVDRPRPLADARREWETAGRPAGLSLHNALGLVSVAHLAPDAVVIAGMGGRTAVEILQSRPSSMAWPTQLIIQPNAQPRLVRAWARSQGLHLRQERLIFEHERYYPIMVFVPGPGPDPAYKVSGFEPAQLEILGPRLLTDGDPHWPAFAGRQADRLSKLESPDAELWRAALATLGRRV